MSETIATDAKCTYAMYFPAALAIWEKENPRPDGQPNVVNDRKVYVTDAGLIIYSTVTDPRDYDACYPEHIYTIDWNRTQPPGHPRNGVTIECEEAKVIITQGNGCGCSHPLKKFFPSFSFQAKPWPGTTP